MCLHVNYVHINAGTTPVEASIPQRWNYTQLWATWNGCLELDLGPLEVQPVLTDEPPSPPPISFKIALTDDCFCSATTKLHETASSLEHGTHGYVHVSTGVLRDQKNQILELEFWVAVNCLIMGAGSRTWVLSKSRLFSNYWAISSAPSPYFSR